MAVGNVVVNRMKSGGEWAHVNTIKDVIYDRKWAVQFSPTVNGSLKKAESGYYIYQNWIWTYDGEM